MPSSPKCRSGVNLPKRWRASSSRAGIPSISHVRCSPLLLGSGDIARQLMTADLIDEVQLFIHPCCSALASGCSVICRYPGR